MMTALLLAATSTLAWGDGTWIVPWDKPDLASPDLACFTELNPFVYAFEGDGDPKLLDEGFLQKSLAARPQGSKIVPVIVNDIVDRKGRMKDAKSIKLLERILGDDKRADKHVRTLLSKVWDDRYDGLEIDYERIPNELYPQFARFLEKLGAELHKRGKYLAVDLEPAPIVKRGGPGAQWWPEFAKHADTLKLMVYYETGSFSEAPGPGASLPWVRELAGKALAAVPKERLMLVYSLAATDWLIPYSRGGKVTRIHYRQVAERLAKKVAEPTFDEALGAPRFAYQDSDGRGHEVWYEDERSLGEKVKIARELGTRAGVWYLGKARPDLNTAGLCRR